MDGKKVTTVDAYISTYPEEVREKLELIRKTIRESAPGAVESISYGMPAFKLNNKPLAYFAAMKSHYGFYPTPSGIESFTEVLKDYKTSKGAIQFPMDKPLPLDLIKRIVKSRVKEVGGA